MCPWSAIAKLTEWIGTMLVLVPLWRAVVVHLHHQSTAVPLRRSMDLIRRHAVSGQPTIDTVALAQAILDEVPPIEGARLGPMLIATAIVGGVLIFIGGGMDFIEKVIGSQAACDVLASRAGVVWPGQ
jgi:hypothetical protein